MPEPRAMRLAVVALGASLVAVARSRGPGQWRKSILGSLAAVAMIGSSARAGPIRLAIVGPGANQAASQVVGTEVPGTDTTLSEAQFNAMSVTQLRANYDALLIGFNATGSLNVDYNTRIGPYLQAGGGVIFESPQNLGDLATLVTGTTDVTSGTFAVIATPILTDGFGTSTSLINAHMTFTTRPAWLSPFLLNGSFTVSLYGESPVGQGRLVLSGPDNDYHGVSGGPGADGNHYQLLVNELRWLAAAVPSLPLVASWNVNALGAWTAGTNWNTGAAPNASDATAIFGPIITAPRTVVVDTAVTVKTIEFNSVHTYAIAGTGSVNLEADTGSSAITVVQGTHEFQARVNLVNDTVADVAAGATLEFNNRLSLGGHTLTKDGGGALQINNDLNTGGGEVVVLEGVVGGVGAIGGDLVNSAGTVTPGIGHGILTVTGNYSQNASSTLAIELAESAQGSQHDQLNVAGVATLAGELSVNLLDGFTPAIGQSFTILTADDIDGTFSTEVLPSLPNLALDVIYNVQSVVLTIVSALPGDYNGDGAVDAADYVVWRKNVGAATINNRDPSGMGPVGDADYNFWRAHFGNTIGSGAGAAGSANPAVPEPMTMLMLFTAMTVAGLPRRRTV
ncbi:MAG: hypothetical protein WD738_12340 [Pirellulales bacterium]